MIKSIAILIISILVIDVAVMAILYMQQTNKLTEARANIVNLERRVSALTGDMETLRRDVANMEAKLTDSETRASNLQMRLTASEAKAAELQIALAKANAGPGQAEGINGLSVPPPYVYRGELHSPGMIPDEVPRR